MFIVIIEQDTCPMWILGKAETLRAAVELVERNTTEAKSLTEVLPGSCSSVVMQFVVIGEIHSLINICAI